MPNAWDKKDCAPLMWLLTSVRPCKSQAMLPVSLPSLLHLIQQRFLVFSLLNSSSILEAGSHTQ